MSLDLGINKNARLASGDFGATVVGRSLLLPERLVEVLRNADVRTGEQFLMFASDFCEYLADELGWSEDELAEARKTLVRLLRAHVRPEVLEAVDAEIIRHPFGAMPPSDER